MSKRFQLEQLSCWDVTCICQAALQIQRLLQAMQVRVQDAMQFVGRVAYHDFGGVADAAEEMAQVAESAAAADIIFLRNHGVIVLGEDIESALSRLYYVERCCQTQLLVHVRYLANMHRRSKLPSQCLQQLAMSPACKLACSSAMGRKPIQAAGCATSQAMVPGEQRTCKPHVQGAGSAVKRAGQMGVQHTVEWYRASGTASARAEFAAHVKDLLAREVACPRTKPFWYE